MRSSRKAALAEDISVEVKKPSRSVHLLTTAGFAETEDAYTKNSNRSSLLQHEVLNDYVRGGIKFSYI